MMKNKRFVLSALASVCASFMAFFTVSAILSLFFQGTETDLLGVLSHTIPYIGGWICAVAVLRLCVGFLPDADAEEERILPEDGEQTAASAEKPSAGALLAASAVTLVILLAVNFAVGILSGNTSDVDVSLPTVLVGVLLKPFCEEALFRYGYTSILVRYGKLSPSFAVAVSAVLFALIHNVSSMLFALLAGVLLGLLVIYCGKDGRDGMRRGALCSFGVHAAYNLILYAVSAIM